jgi:hypothetical protein
MKSGIVRLLTCGLLAFGLTACAPAPRQGMVLDQRTGISWGSVVENNILLDASQLANRNANISVRNVSGDEAYDIQGLRGVFSDVLGQKGYAVNQGDGFGVKFDVNVLYSGQARQDMMTQFAFLGGATGGLASYGGAHAGRNTLAGTVAGATLGAIAGSYVTEDTYMVVLEVSIAIIDQNLGTTTRTITFSSSPAAREHTRSNVKPFEQVLRTKIAVFAGGRNLPHDAVVEGVRRRISNIVSNIV